MRWWPPRRKLPRTTDVAIRQALYATLNHDPDRAEAMLTRAIEIDPDEIDAYLILGRFYRNRGEIGRAIRLHQNLLLRRDFEGARRTETLAELAADFQQGGFLRRAIASYEEVLAHDAKHEGALRALVDLLANVREFDRAIEMHRRMIKLAGGSASEGESELLRQMAETAEAEGRSGDARRAVKRSLRRDGKNVQAWVLLGSLEADRGRTRAALAAWRKVPQLDRRAGTLVYARLESAFAAAGRTRDYENYLRSLLEADAEDPGARLALARTLVARGESDQAVNEIRQVLERDPDHLEAHSVLGRSLLAAGRDPEALKSLDELLEALSRQGLLRSQESLE